VQLSLTVCILVLLSFPPQRLDLPSKAIVGKASGISQSKTSRQSTSEEEQMYDRVQVNMSQVKFWSLRIGDVNTGLLVFCTFMDHQKTNLTPMAASTNSFIR
jgi:hypothetical protein